MSGLFTLALTLHGCATEPAPAPAPVAARPRRAKVPGPRAPAVPTTPPLGVPGPVLGELTMTVQEPPPGGAPTPPQPRTVASLSLTFADGTTREVPLGQVDGTCVDAPPRPVGPPGKELPSLWSVSCTGAGGASEVHLVQKEAAILVVRSTSPGGVPQLKTVRRVALAPGAIVSRKG